MRRIRGSRCVPCTLPNKTAKLGCCVRKRTCDFIKTTKNMLHKKRKMNIFFKIARLFWKLRQGPFLGWATVTYEPQAHPPCVAGNKFRLMLSHIQAACRMSDPMLRIMYRSWDWD
jgi:hypothetical protein